MSIRAYVLHYIYSIYIYISIYIIISYITFIDGYLVVSQKQGTPKPKSNQQESRV